MRQEIFSFLKNLLKSIEECLTGELQNHVKLFEWQYSVEFVEKQLEDSSFKCDKTRLFESINK